MCIVRLREDFAREEAAEGAVAAGDEIDGVVVEGDRRLRCVDSDLLSMQFAGAAVQGQAAGQLRILERGRFQKRGKPGV